MKAKLQTSASQQLSRHSVVPNAAKRNRVTTERYSPSPIVKRDDTMTNREKEPLSPSTSSSSSFTVGQHVWVVVGREMHPAVINAIFQSNNMVRVQWTTMRSHAEASMDDIKPMFDINTDGGFVSSRFSKRKREQTDRFVPLMNSSQKKVAIKCDTLLHQRVNLNKKEQCSPVKRGKKTNTMHHPLTKRKPHQKSLYKLTPMKAKLQTSASQQLSRHSVVPNAAKRNRVTTERYAPSPIVKKEDTMTNREKEPLSPPTSSSPSFTVGQHVWVIVGREMHPAVIKAIFQSNNMVRVQWTTMRSHAEASMDDIKPMFDINTDDGFVSSRFSKRKREQTDRFVPLMNSSQKKVAIKCDTLLHQRVNLNKKEQCSPVKRGKKKNTKRVKSLVRKKMHYPLTKRKPHQNCLEEQSREKEIEENYNQLWELYLEPKVRRNEELPGGMCIRQKRATCSLLRCHSRFRRQLYAKIIRLDREGKRNEIHRMLKLMREHDVAGVAGDGPKELMEEILHFPSDVHDDVVCIGSSPAPTKRVEQVRDVIDLRDDIVANTAFEPIDPALDSVARGKSSSVELTERKSVQDKVNSHNLDDSEEEVNDTPNLHNVTDEKRAEIQGEGSGANFATTQAERGVSSPSVVNAIDNMEHKKFQQTEECSISLSTVSSLTDPCDATKFTWPQIPTMIVIRRRDFSFPKDTDDTNGTTSNNTASSGEDNMQTNFQAANSENRAHRIGLGECIDLCESEDDQSVSFHGD